MDFQEDIWNLIKLFLINEKYEKLYYDIVNEVIKPYHFSDHKNKHFDKQLSYILNNFKYELKNIPRTIIERNVHRAIKKALQIYN